MLIDIRDRRSLYWPELIPLPLPPAQETELALSPLPDTEDWVDLLQHFRRNLNGTAQVNPHRNQPYSCVTLLTQG